LPRGINISDSGFAFPFIGLSCADTGRPNTQPLARLIASRRSDRRNLKSSQQKSDCFSLQKCRLFLIKNPDCFSTEILTDSLFKNADCF
jgi:hypothetical protein